MPFWFFSPCMFFTYVDYGCSFGIVTLLYAGTAVMGYMMFGDSSESQFTLNMPKGLVASKVAVWTTVCQTTSPSVFSYN